MEIRKVVVGHLVTNCYLASSGGEIIIIDSGDETEKILKEINKIGGKPKYIILTHYHFDHVLAAEKIKEKTGAQILIHQADKDFLQFAADKYLKENDEIKVGSEILKVIHTPGHTQGSICLLTQKEIFVGDLIFEDGYGRTDLPGGSEEDLKNSLKKISKLLKKGMIIYPGHGVKYKK